MFDVEVTPVWGVDVRGDVTVRDGESADPSRCKVCRDVAQRGWTVVTGPFAGESRCETCGDTERRD